jgi:hypothetical protein
MARLITIPTAVGCYCNSTLFVVRGSHNSSLINLSEDNFSIAPEI